MHAFEVGKELLFWEILILLKSEESVSLLIWYIMLHQIYLTAQL